MLPCDSRTATVVTTATKRRLWTYADYCRIPADRYRHEIIDGKHFVNPSPSPYHQTVSVFLTHQLVDRLVEPGLGRIFNAPIDVNIGRRTLVVPDIVVVSTPPYTHAPIATA